MPVTLSSEPGSAGICIRGLRWWIVTLVFLATLISYIDRLTVSVLAPVICADLHLSNLAYASVNTWFLLTYSLGQTFFGKLHDWVGTRRGFAAAMAVWSIAEVAHAWARGLFSLSAFRLGLGVGEAGHWPAATKTAAEWFPTQERALGMGIINSGAALGSAIAAPLVVWLELGYGWQTTFVVTGSMGFIWLVLWLIFYRLPERHPWIHASERRYILSGQTESERAGSPSWRGLLRHPGVWGIVLARFLADSVWWFYLIWLPLYLHTARGFSLKDIGLFVWIPYVAADAGSLLGGWTSGHLIHRGWQVYRARAAAILIATLLSPAGLFIAHVKSPGAALLLISIVLFSFQFWVNNVQTLPSDLFPTRFVGSIAGFAGTAAGIGAMIFTLSTGWITERFSYKPMLFAASLLVPLATLALIVLVRPSHFRQFVPAKD
ncbi:MAG: MFS transporter [Terriglobia bacterium]